MNEKMNEKIEDDYHGFYLGNNIKEPVGNLNERWTDIPVEEWGAEIQNTWRHMLFSGIADTSSPMFLDKIWEASVDTLGGLEVSVIVDANDVLFMNSGSPRS